jgi:N-acyl-D-aspartate/D-glutamate deacylase
MRYDKVIKNGLIVDGTRNQRFRGDIGIKGGNIAELGYIDALEADEVIDAEGLIVAPGFIDLHTHYDSQLYWDPYCTLSGWHGVTSVVIGNCGFGFAPMKPELRERAMLTMTRVEAIPLASMKKGMPWDWVTFPEFLDSVDRAPKAVNILPYVPVGPLLIWVLGFEDAKAGRMPTNAEHAEICRLLDEAMDAGACGWSAQRMQPESGVAVQNDFDGTPMVTDVMHDETCIELAKVLARRNDGFMQMSLFTGEQEHRHFHFEQLAQIARRPILMNTLSGFDADPRVHREELAWIESCRERGLLVIPQGNTVEAGFTFTFEEWNMWDDVPVWREATTGTIEQRKAKLSNPSIRSRLKESKQPSLGNIDDVVLVGPKLEKNKEFIDHRIALLAQKTGKHPVDALLDIVTEENLKTVCYQPAINRNIEFLRELAAYPWLVFGVSDGGAHTRFLTTGRYPTETITKVVREHAMLTLEEVHWRLSALPARVAGFKDRGMLIPGMSADIVIYDFDHLKVLDEEILHDQPGNEWRRVQRASGYRYVLVNGEITIRDDEETKTYSGRLLRGGEKRASAEQMMAG